MNKTVVSVVIGIAMGTLPRVACAQMFAGSAPPPMRAESVPHAPGQGLAWLPGFWSLSGNQFAWAPGRWERPPAPSLRWNPPAWRRDGSRYRFLPGRWGQEGAGGRGGRMVEPVMAQGQTALPVGFRDGPRGPHAGVVGAQRADAWQTTRRPPRARMERRPPPPQRGMRWLAGHWSWDNHQHAWTPGRWEAPPRPGARWQAPRWQRRGNQWHFRQGLWR